MKRIPIKAARRIAKEYGYDQVVIYARKVSVVTDGVTAHGGEHMTTYGVDKVHCGVAARMAHELQRFMGWRND